MHRLCAFGATAFPFNYRRMLRLRWRKEGEESSAALTKAD
jgi:hypothetical protein